MSDGIRPVLPGVYASARAAAMAEIVDLVVFDVDGVLVDVSQSFPVMICRVVTQFLTEHGFQGPGEALTPEETRWFKAAGGFNSDWTLASAAALYFLAQAERTGDRSWDRLIHTAPTLRDLLRGVARFGGGMGVFRRALLEDLSPAAAARVEGEWDRERIERLAMEFYAGPHCVEVYGVPAETHRGPGVMDTERALADADQLVAGIRYGLYTGRTGGETRAALGITGLERLLTPGAVITADAGVVKPNPEGLMRAAATTHPRVLMYVGDNLDDWDTASRYETERGPADPPCLFAGILSGALGPSAWELFQSRGVEVVSDGVPNLMQWLKSRQVLAAGGV